jgi:hypothetical protein
MDRLTTAGAQDWQHLIIAAAEIQLHDALASDNQCAAQFWVGALQVGHHGA